MKQFSNTLQLDIYVHQYRLLRRLILTWKPCGILDGEYVDVEVPVEAICSDSLNRSLGTATRRSVPTIPHSEQIKMGC
jgi:hypothetical protein